MSHFKASECQLNIYGYKDFKGFTEIEYKQSRSIEAQHSIGQTNPYNRSEGKPEYSGKITFIAEAYFDQILDKIPKGNSEFDAAPSDIIVTYAGYLRKETSIKLINVMFTDITHKITTDKVEPIPIDFYFEGIEKL